MGDQYRQRLDDMMQREVSRGEFLKFVGIAMLSFVGIVGFLKNLHEIVPDNNASKKQLASAGYGRSAYGR
jgi:hypothetical protein